MGARFRYGASARRNLEAVRVFLGATPGWKAMRLLANEDEVMIAMHTAVAEWNSENCLVKRFNKQVAAVRRAPLLTPLVALRVQRLAAVLP